MNILWENLDWSLCFHFLFSQPNFHLVSIPGYKEGNFSNFLLSTALYMWNTEKKLTSQVWETPGGDPRPDLIAGGSKAGRFSMFSAQFRDVSLSQSCCMTSLPICSCFRSWSLCSPCYVNKETWLGYYSCRAAAILQFHSDQHTAVSRWILI